MARRVVTGVGADGKGTILADAEPPRAVALKTLPAFRGALVWATDTVPQLAGERRAVLDDASAEVPSFVPAPGGTRLHVMHFPPDSVMADPLLDFEAVVGEQLAQMPGLAERFAPDGMHDTPTLDYAIVLEGEVWLELDGGEQTHLHAGDIVIQQGARHAWRNRSNADVVMVFVMVGAQI